MDQSGVSRVEGRKLKEGEGQNLKWLSLFLCFPTGKKVAEIELCRLKQICRELKGDGIVDITFFFQLCKEKDIEKKGSRIIEMAEQPRLDAGVEERKMKKKEARK